MLLTIRSSIATGICEQMDTTKGIRNDTPEDAATNTNAGSSSCLIAVPSTGQHELGSPDPSFMATANILHRIPAIESPDSGTRHPKGHVRGPEPSLAWRWNRRLCRRSSINEHV